MYLSGMNCHYRYYDLEFCFKKLSKTGFQKMELWTGPMHFYVDYRTNEDPGKLQLLSRKYGIDIIAVCPEQTNPKPNNIASASRQDDIFNYYQRIIDIAEKCKSKKVTVTSGWAYRNENFEQAYERSVKMIRRIARYAAEKGINLVMEALQPEESILVNSSKDLKKYIDRVGEHNLKVCIDFGAMAKMGETIDDYFENCGSLIEHIHFVDGKPTGHLAYPTATGILSLTCKHYSSMGIKAIYLVRAWQVFTMKNRGLQMRKIIRLFLRERRNWKKPGFHHLLSDK